MSDQGSLLSLLPVLREEAERWLGNRDAMYTSVLGKKSLKAAELSPEFKYLIQTFERLHEKYLTNNIWQSL